MNIVLIGYRGTGKSVVGALLAARLGMAKLEGKALEDPGERARAVCLVSLVLEEIPEDLDEVVLVIEKRVLLTAAIRLQRLPAIRIGNKPLDVLGQVVVFGIVQPKEHQHGYVFDILLH